MATTPSSNTSAMRRYRSGMTAEAKEVARVKARNRVRERRAARKREIANYDNTKPVERKTKDVRTQTVDRTRK